MTLLVIVFSIRLVPKTTVPIKAVVAIPGGLVSNTVGPICQKRNIQPAFIALLIVD